MGAGIGNFYNIGDIKFRGKALPDSHHERISTVTLDMSIDQITELTITFDDPYFELLQSGVYEMETPVTYRGLNLLVAVIETNSGGGAGGFGVRCRPKMVYKLKKLKGKKVRKNISPTTFLLSECKAAGIVKANVVAQNTNKKKQIARDTKQKGTSYDPTSAPSAWTTMQRLATEKGFLLYEVGNTLFFGKPTWLVGRSKKVQVVWDGNDQAPLSFPEFRKSLDSEDVELNIKLPVERASELRPGIGLTLSNYPKFSGTYLIRTIQYPLVGPGEITVTASTVRNPEPQRSGDTSSDDSKPARSERRRFPASSSSQAPSRSNPNRVKNPTRTGSSKSQVDFGNTRFDFDPALDGFGNMFD